MLLAPFVQKEHSCFTRAAEVPETFEKLVCVSFIFASLWENTPLFKWHIQAYEFTPTDLIWILNSLLGGMFYRTGRTSCLGVISCIFLKKKKQKKTKKRSRRRRSRKSNSKGMFEVFPSDYVPLPLSFVTRINPLWPTQSMPKEQILLKANFCLCQGVGDMTETSFYKQVPALLWETVLYCQ